VPSTPFSFVQLMKCSDSGDSEPPTGAAMYSCAEVLGFSVHGKHTGKWLVEAVPAPYASGFWFSRLGAGLQCAFLATSLGDVGATGLE
jgi:hypothetical protein